MHSRRVLGVVALCAIVIAAISFTVVDISTTGASGCLGASAGCAERSVPIVAITFAALGIVALLASIAPAVAWIVESAHETRTVLSESDLKAMRAARRRPAEHADDEA